MGWLGQASEHETNHGETYEGGDGSSVALEIARQAAVSTDPGERALDDPAFGENDEAMQLVTLDDLQGPGAGCGDGCGQHRSLVAGIGEDALDEGEQAAGTSIENQPRPVAVLNIAGMNDDVQQKAERIDQDMALAPGDLLARIVALRVERGAPF